MTPEEVALVPLRDRVVTLREWWTKITQNRIDNDDNNKNNNNGQDNDNDNKDSITGEQQVHHHYHKLLDVRPLPPKTKTSKPDNNTENNRSWHRRQLCFRPPPATTTSSSPSSSTSSSSSRVVVESVHIPIDELKERSFELPARHVKFSLLVLPEDVERASDFLLYGNHRYHRKKSENDSSNHERKNKDNDNDNDEDEETTSQQQPKKKKLKQNRQGRKLNPWKVTHVLVDDGKLWDDAMKLGLLEDPDTVRSNRDDNNGEDHRPLPRLWQPDSMVQNILLPLLKESIINQQMKGKDESEETLEVWDLASGSARDVAFLAEELKHHYHSHRSTVDGNIDSQDGCTKDKIVVVGCDHRYNAKEIGIVSNFWSRRKVKEYTRPLKIDLSQWSTLHQEMSMSKLMAMYCVRFWKVELVTSIASCDQIPKGVLFAISHFCKPSPNAQWDFDHPSEKTVLERNQLSSIFGSQGWTILHDEITTDSDRGRPMINFVARR